MRSLLFTDGKVKGDIDIVGYKMDEESTSLPLLAPLSASSAGTRTVIATAWSHDGSVFAATSGDHTVRVYPSSYGTGDGPRSAPLSILHGHVHTPFLCAFHPFRADILVTGSPAVATQPQHQPQAQAGQQGKQSAQVQQADAGQNAGRARAASSSGPVAVPRAQLILWHWPSGRAMATASVRSEGGAASMTGCWSACGSAVLIGCGNTISAWPLRPQALGLPPDVLTGHARPSGDGHSGITQAEAQHHGEPLQAGHEADVVEMEDTTGSMKASQARAGTALRLLDAAVARLQALAVYAQPAANAGSELLAAAAQTNAVSQPRELPAEQALAFAPGSVPAPLAQLPKSHYRCVRALSLSLCGRTMYAAVEMRQPELHETHTIGTARQPQDMCGASCCVLAWVLDVEAVHHAVDSYEADTRAWAAGQQTTGQAKGQQAQEGHSGAAVAALVTLPSTGSMPAVVDSQPGPGPRFSSFAGSLMWPGGVNGMVGAGAAGVAQGNSTPSDPGTSSLTPSPVNDTDDVMAGDGGAAPGTTPSDSQARSTQKAGAAVSPRASVPSRSTSSSSLALLFNRGRSRSALSTASEAQEGKGQLQGLNTSVDGQAGRAGAGAMATASTVTGVSLSRESSECLSVHRGSVGGPGSGRGYGHFVTGHGQGPLPTAGCPHWTPAVYSDRAWMQPLVPSWAATSTAWAAARAFGAFHGRSMGEDEGSSKRPRPGPGHTADDASMSGGVAEGNQHPGLSLDGPGPEPAEDAPAGRDACLTTSSAMTAGSLATSERGVYGGYCPLIGPVLVTDRCVMYHGAGLHVSEVCLRDGMSGRVSSLASSLVLVTSAAAVQAQVHHAESSAEEDTARLEDGQNLWRAVRGMQFSRAVRARAGTGVTDASDGTAIAGHGQAWGQVRPGRSLSSSSFSMGQANGSTVLGAPFIVASESGFQAPSGPVRATRMSMGSFSGGLETRARASLSFSKPMPAPADAGQGRPGAMDTGSNGIAPARSPVLSGGSIGSATGGNVPLAPALSSMSRKRSLAERDSGDTRRVSFSSVTSGSASGAMDGRHPSISSPRLMEAGEGRPRQGSPPINPAPGASSPHSSSFLSSDPDRLSSVAALAAAALEGLIDDDVDEVDEDQLGHGQGHSGHGGQQQGLDSPTAQDMMVVGHTRARAAVSFSVDTGGRERRTVSAVGMAGHHSSLGPQARLSHPRGQVPLNNGTVAVQGVAPGGLGHRSYSGTNLVELGQAHAGGAVWPNAACQGQLDSHGSARTAVNAPRAADDALTDLLLTSLWQRVAAAEGWPVLGNRFGGHPSSAGSHNGHTGAGSGTGSNGTTDVMSVPGRTAVVMVLSSGRDRAKCGSSGAGKGPCARQLAHPAYALACDTVTWPVPGMAADCVTTVQASPCGSHVLLGGEPPVDRPAPVPSSGPSQGPGGPISPTYSSASDRLLGDVDLLATAMARVTVSDPARPGQGPAPSSQHSAAPSGPAGTILRAVHLSTGASVLDVSSSSSQVNSVAWVPRGSSRAYGGASLAGLPSSAAGTPGLALAHPGFVYGTRRGQVRRFAVVAQQTGQPAEAGLAPAVTITAAAVPVQGQSSAPAPASAFAGGLSWPQAAFVNPWRTAGSAAGQAAGAASGQAASGMTTAVQPTTPTPAPAAQASAAPAPAVARPSIAAQLAAAFAGVRGAGSGSAGQGTS